MNLFGRTTKSLYLMAFVLVVIVDFVGNGFCGEDHSRDPGFQKSTESHDEAGDDGIRLCKA